jgi:hypothetical protein
MKYPIPFSVRSIKRISKKTFEGEMFVNPEFIHFIYLVSGKTPKETIKTLESDISSKFIDKKYKNIYISLCVNLWINFPNGWVTEDDITLTLNSVINKSNNYQ